MTADEFLEAGSLPVGHQVTDPHGKTQTLVGSTREEFPNGIPVFNFQVTDYHTYFVAASPDNPIMLVHNANCDEVVDLFRAPSGSRPQSQILDELQNGFNSANYPGNGPYFATDKSIAEAFQGHYGNGLQQIRIPKAKYDELVAQGVIQPDGYYSSGSVHVPANLLDAFNEALKQGPANVLH